MRSELHVSHTAALQLPVVRSAQTAHLPEACLTENREQTTPSLFSQESLRHILSHALLF